MLLAVLLIIAFVLGVVSLGTAWWSYASSGGGGSISLGFVPGGDYVVTCTNCGGFASGSFSYGNFGGSLGGLYEALLGLMGLAVALTALAAIIAVLSAMGRRTGWWQRSGSFILVFVAVFATLIATVAVVTAQPGAFGPNSTFQGLGPGNASPTTSFWGTDAAGTASWGAGIGWYLALASGVLLVVITVLLVVLGHARLRVPERETRSAAPVAPTLHGYTPPPTAAPYARPVATRPPILSPTRVTPRPSAPTASVPAARREGADAYPEAPAGGAPLPVPRPVPAAPQATLECPNCGTTNLAKSRTCSYCQRPLKA